MTTHSSPKMGRLAAASSVGTTLEWYDFTIYNLMAALVFNTVFFPSFDPLTGTSSMPATKNASATVGAQILRLH